MCRWPPSSLLSPTYICDTIIMFSCANDDVAVRFSGEGLSGDGDGRLVHECVMRVCECCVRGHRRASKSCVFVSDMKLIENFIWTHKNTQASFVCG